MSGGPAADPDVAIRLDGLTKLYGPRVVVDHLDFQVRTGTVCGFAGPNGAGKTTTIRMLLGLVTPSGGNATVLGHSVAAPAKYLPAVGAMIEGPAFHPALSGRRNLIALARIASLPPRRVDEVLTRVGLSERARDPYRAYSLGMKQRLGIAAALLTRPRLLVLDEPTNGLDPPGIREIRELLRELTGQGVSVLVSSHLLDEMEQMCDDVVIIRQGRLIFAGPVGDLLARGTASLTATPQHTADLPALVTLCTSQGYNARIEGTRVRVDSPRDWAGRLNELAMRNRIVLVELGASTQSLEDVFFELTAGQS